jgi:alkylated DNA repair dioxygenase AlkB
MGKAGRLQLGSPFLWCLEMVVLLPVPNQNEPTMRHFANWTDSSTAQHWFEQLVEKVPWKQEQIKLFGRCHLLPRLTCWMADPGCGYRYSNLENQIEPWLPITNIIRQQIIATVGSPFNSLLLNYYRNGNDAMGWHADDEPELDPFAPIASLSLGASRTFRFKQKVRFKQKSRSCEPNSQKTISLELNHGDLLIMDYPTQQNWVHAIPRRLKIKEARLNLTFRLVRSGLNQ